MKQKAIAIVFVLIVLLVAVAASSNRRIRMKIGESVTVRCEASNPNLVPLWDHWEDQGDWLLTCEWGLD